MKFIKILLFFVSLKVCGQDCVPSTMCRVFPAISYREMAKLLATDDTGTKLNVLIKAYSTLSTNKLHCIFSTVPKEIPSEDVPIELDRPYLWIGICQGGEHCALVKFGNTNVVMSNSQYYSHTTNYFLVTMDYPTFFTNTQFIFTSKDLEKPIRFY